MPAKPPAKRRRRPPKRRKAVARRRRPRWILRIILTGGLLFVVFCAAAGATLWFTATIRQSPLRGASDSAGTTERLNDDERDALDRLLNDQKPAARP